MVERVVQSLIIPPGLAFDRYLRAGLHRPEVDLVYLTWVSTLPCVVCMLEPCTYHHLVGWGLKGKHSKVSDYLTFPLCEGHHTRGPDAIHVIGSSAWEDRFGSQPWHVMLTLYRAIAEGVLHGFHGG